MAIHFVSLSSDTNPNVQDAASRRLIRARAACAARSRDTDRNSERHYKQSIAASGASQRGGMNRFRSQPPTTPGKKLSKVASCSSPIDHHLSVWSPVIGSLGHQARNLLHYYRFFFRARSWAISAKQDWFAFIIEDPAATHATLSFVSLNRDLEEGNTVSPWTLGHRHRALHLIRQELAGQYDPPKDALIGAIALLALTEGLEGHSLSSSAHVEALSKLVHLRGGFARLRNNKALSSLVAWANLCHDSAFPNAPQIPNFSDRSDLMLGQPESEILDDTQRSLLNTMKRLMPSEVFQMLRLLNFVPQYPPTESTTPREQHDVSLLVHDINQVLLSIHRNTTAFEIDPVSRLAKTLCYATHVYVSLVLRQMPRRTKVIIERGAKLDEALHELESVTNWDKDLIESYLIVSLWAHTVHFCSSTTTPQVKFQNSALNYLLSTLSISDSEQHCQQLSRISWVKLSLDDELKCILEQRSKAT